MVADDLAQLVATNREKGGRRSPLYSWLRARHDTLAEAIEADGASWPTIAASLAKAGLTDGAGKPPTPERARKCWHQVKTDVAAAREKAAAKRKPLVSVSLAAAPPLPSPASFEPPRPTDQPSVALPPIQPVTGGDDDPLARLKRTLNERSGRR